MKKVVLAVGALALTISVLLIAMPFVYISETITEPYQVPKSLQLQKNSFILDSGDMYSSQNAPLELTEEDVINVKVDSYPAVDFYFIEVRNGGLNYSFPSCVDMDQNWTIPTSGKYYFVFNNPDSMTPTNTTIIVKRIWTETAYRDVSINRQLLPFEYAYLGVILILAGLGISIYALNEK